MKRLSGWDAMLLYNETPNLTQHTMKVALADTTDFDGDFTFELFQRTFRRRMHLLDPLRYQLVDIPLQMHHPMWLENVDVDIDQHTHRIEVPAPGGRRELDTVIGEIAATPLRRDRPLWQFYFAEGLAKNRVAMIGKVHHALADGVASANLLARALDINPGPQREQDACRADQQPSKAALVGAAMRDHAKQIRGIPDLLRYTASGLRRSRRHNREVPGLARNFNPPETFLNHLVAPGRRFASATLALAEVKETGKRLGATINDMVLAISSGALRELLIRYDGSADEPILGGVPRSLDSSPDRISGNDLGTIVVSLPVHVTDPLDWVRLATVGADVGKAKSDDLGPELVSRWSNYLPPALAKAGLRFVSTREVPNKLVNVAVSNVPGPRVRGSISGATLSEIYSVGPLTFGVGINITVWSYVDQLNISVLEDGATVGDPHEITDAMVEAFVRIRKSAGFADTNTAVSTAIG